CSDIVDPTGWTTSTYTIVAASPPPAALAAPTVSVEVVPTGAGTIVAALLTVHVDYSGPWSDAWFGRVTLADASSFPVYQPLSSCGRPGAGVDYQVSPVCPGYGPSYGAGNAEVPPGSHTVEVAAGPWGHDPALTAQTMVTLDCLPPGPDGGTAGDAGAAS